jgi:uncharacterized protein (TIGR03437 family)
MATSPASHSAAQFSYPGCVPTISANGALDGIVWVLEISGVLRAYDASNLAHELYNSNQNKPRDALGAAVKFSVPTVVNGKVYAATQSSLAVYGLLPGIVTSVANAASGDASAVAPGSIASLYGSGLAPSIGIASTFPVPAMLGGASVYINGVSLPVPLFYAGPSQINFQVPFELSGNAAFTVVAGGTPIASGSMPLRKTAPGIFLLPQSRAAAVNQDGSINSTDHAAAPGSAIAVYATGLGAVNPPVATGAQASTGSLSAVIAAVTATVGGQPARVLFAGLAPGYVGLYQVNVLLPQLAPGDYPLTVSAGGVASNRATISIR